jgi:hypothetical protein
MTGNETETLRLLLTVTLPWGMAALAGILVPWLIAGRCLGLWRRNRG